MIACPKSPCGPINSLDNYRTFYISKIEVDEFVFIAEKCNKNIFRAITFLVKNMKGKADRRVGKFAEGYQKLTLL